MSLKREFKPCMKELKAIAAMAKNRVIGHRGAIPWHIPDELRWFKKVTTGQTIIMGRKTFESLGRPLPNRRNIVLSRRGLDRPMEGVEVAPDIASLERLLQGNEEGREAWIIGGAEIYAALLPFCMELLLTEVPLEPEGDAWFPAFEREFAFREVAFEHPQFTVRRYLRR